MLCYVTYGILCDVLNHWVFAAWLMDRLYVQYSAQIQRVNNHNILQNIRRTHMEVLNRL